MANKSDNQVLRNQNRIQLIFVLAKIVASLCKTISNLFSLSFLKDKNRFCQFISGGLSMRCERANEMSMILKNFCAACAARVLFIGRIWKQVPISNFF